MADKKTSRGIYLYIDGKQVTGSVRSIQNEMRVLVKEQANMERGSKEYINAARKIAQLDTILQQHKDYQRSVTQEYRKMSGAADDFEQKSNKAFSLDSIASGINKLKGAVVGFIASFTVDRAIDEFAKLDDKYADVMKTTGQTREEVVAMNDVFNKIDTRTARMQLNDMAEEAGRIGIAKDEVTDFVKAMDIANVALGDSFTGGASEIANTLGKLKFLFQDTQNMGVEKAYLSIASAINELGANGVASEVNIANFTTRLGSLSDSLKPPISEALALGAAFEESGIEAEIASRAYSIFLQKASTNTAGFAKVMGLSVKEVENLINTDPVTFFLKFSESMKGLSATDVSKTLKELKLNADGVNKVVGAAASNTDRFRELINLSNKSFEEGTSVINEFNIKNNTFGAQLDKNKKVLQDYIYELGERLAPIVLEGTSAVNMLLKVLTSIISVLINNKTAVLSVITAYVAYNVALKANTLWVERSNIASKVMIAGNAILKGSLYALQVAYYSLTGQVSKAKEAMVAFNMTTNLTNPIGILTGAITALGAGLAVLIIKTKNVMTAQKAVKEATKDLNDELGKEESQSNRLFEALKRANPESEEYRKLKNQIIKLYGPYLKGLIDEKGNLIDIARAQAAVNNKIRENISLKIKNAATDKIQQASVNEQISDLNNVMDIVEKQMNNKDAANVVRENINKAITEAVANGKTSMAELTDAIQDVLKGENLDLKGRFGFWEPKSLYMATFKLASGVYRAQNEIKKVESQFKGMISDAAELDSLLSGEGTIDTKDKDGGGDNPDTKADKTAVQRKKVQDALRELEEQHLKNMSEIKARYLNGDIKTEEEYNQVILKQQDAYDQERKTKLQDLLKSLTDPSLRIDIAKQIADIDAKAFDRQISDMEKRRKALAKWNDEETKKIVQTALNDVDALESKAEQELALLRAKNEISDVEYRSRLLENEKKYLEERLRINGLAEEEKAKIRQQLDKNSGEQDINKADMRTSALDKYGLISIQNQKEQELALIKYYEDQGILTHEEAMKTRIQADQNYLEGLTTKVSDVNEKIQMIGGNLTGAMTNFASAEESAVSRKYDKQIAAAEGNSKKQKKLEAQKQKEINAIKAKYADKQFAVTTAMTIATTAQAAMEAYKAMAGIPIVGPALGAAAAAAAVAYGKSQIDVAKEQRDAAKEGYYKGGYYIDEGYTGGGDPKQVRGYLPDGSPVHGREFIANHATTSLFSPLFDIFDEAQKHNTVSSISKRDLAKALQIPTGYYQGGYSGAAPSSPTVIRDSRYDELYVRITDIMERLDEKMDVPFKGYVVYKGDNGIEDAQDLDKKMMKNISR